MSSPTTDSATFQAAELLGQLFDGLRASGFGDFPAQDRALEELLMRVAFCCFAQDSGILEEGQFRSLLENHTRSDGSDTAAHLHQLFQTLSQPVASRPPRLLPALAGLPYLGGALFGQVLPLPAFTAELRERLLACARGAWAHIAPPVFIALFQALHDPYQRQRLNDHYLPEADIFKVIGPLFLDELRQELTQAGSDADRLDRLHARLVALRLFDPACGNGSFLAGAYRELRLLELKLLQAHLGARLHALLPRVRLSQCAGLEADPFAARLAELALWLLDHQLNQHLAAALGQPNQRPPLAETLHLVRGASQEANWEEGLPPIDYLFGDFRRSRQGIQTDWRLGRPEVWWSHFQATGGLVWVARYLAYEPKARAAFLLHKDDMQGPLNADMWREMQHEHGVIIQFAHRPFASGRLLSQKTDARSVVVGIGRQAGGPKQLFAYDTPTGEPRQQLVPRINHYLLAASEVWFGYRQQPLANVPALARSHYAAARHAFVLDADARRALLARQPAAAPYLYPFVQGITYRNPRPLWHLPLAVALAHGWEQLPGLNAMWEAKLEFERNYPRVELPEFAQSEKLTEGKGQPISNFIVLPAGMLSDSPYLSAVLLPDEAVIDGSVEFIPHATPYLFGLILSAMFGTWVRQLCGNWKYGYKNQGLLTYHNFPFPPAPTPAQMAAVAAGVAAVQAAQGPQQGPGPVYDYWGETLSAERLAAAAQLDEAVDRCFRTEPFATEQERLEFLFAAFQERAAALGEAE
ncbi:DNA methyltransferase [Hymenobacter properus]|uniref:site-specific DNA-methyltransferase (adenine-specific) n=1 Tax=Hymenobacter properus TaxID=2791026 RepID=A0A931FH38_9BACT|nr:DNA methyltransferase [Hymenobacter properus]MBF9140652.1 hypothetical protein [Hymenobacter properus]MBR7719460.1 hypothetical protein [Microvirga sp. SRT04]